MATAITGQRRMYAKDTITSSARASNLSQTKALALVPGIRLQESALLSRSDGDGHDYRHACRRLHTRRRGRPNLFQGRAWLFLRRCRRWMADLCRAPL